MLNIRKSYYVLILVAACASIAMWIKFSYPTFALVDLSVGRTQALHIARDYLKTKENIDPAQFKQAIVFKKPVYIGEKLRVSGKIISKVEATRMLDIALKIYTIGEGKEEIAIEGEAKVQVI